MIVVASLARAAAAVLACSMAHAGGAAPRAGAPARVGAEICAACHTGQAERFRASVHDRNLAEKGIAADARCETCHGPGAAHAAAGGDRENPDFQTIRGPRTEKEGLTAACLSCHKATHPHFGETRHDRRGVACADCHSIHSRKRPGVEQGSLLSAGSVNETCFSCHRDKKAHVSRAAHMPVGEGKVTCTSCHDPHGSAHEKQLKAASANELCTGCHAEKRGPFLFEHPPARDNCLTCHDAHGSQHDKMLRFKRPVLACQQCHVGTRHPSTLYEAEALAQQSNRLVNRSCQNCHTAIHGSNHPSGKFFLR